MDKQKVVRILEELIDEIKGPERVEPIQLPPIIEERVPDEPTRLFAYRYTGRVWLGSVIWFDAEVDVPANMERFPQADMIV